MKFIQIVHGEEVTITCEALLLFSDGKEGFVKSLEADRKISGLIHATMESSICAMTRYSPGPLIVVIHLQLTEAEHKVKTSKTVEKQDN